MASFIRRGSVKTIIPGRVCLDTREGVKMYESTKLFKINNFNQAEFSRTKL